MRYLRNIQLNEIGHEGQKMLLNSSVLVIGCGGLGSPAAYYLAACGIGRIGLVDCTIVDVSNLQRQILFSDSDVGRYKVEVAEKRLKGLNPDIKIEAAKTEISKDNIKGIIKKYDFVLDAVDNFESKYLINDACIKNQKPFVHAGVKEWAGQIMTVMPGKSACYRCFFNNEGIKLPSPSAYGIFNIVTGVIGLLEAGEAVKYILGRGGLLVDKLLIYDALETKFRVVNVNRNKECPVCGN